MQIEVAYTDNVVAAHKLVPEGIPSLRQAEGGYGVKQASFIFDTCAVHQPACRVLLLVGIFALSLTEM